MKRLVIAVDCDDVLVPSTEKIVELYNQRYGTKVALPGAHISSNPDWQASREEIAERIYDIQLTDFYIQTVPFDDAIRACRELAKKHELHLVTARPGRIMHTTLAMLDRYFHGVFTEIERVGLDGDKGQICRRLQADVLIDDNAKYLESAGRSGVRNLLWFGNYPWQDEEGMTTKGVIRCANWARVEEEIERIAK